MGIVSFGAPRELIEKLCSTFQIATFVETGTYMGGTTAWASDRFERVITIEGLPEFQNKAKENCADKHNIEFLLGDSRVMLREAMAKLGGKPALFWLDAHWMPSSFGEGHECPILEEIATIHQSNAEHFILIDDARLFLAPPPLPHRARDWPDVGTVLSALKTPAHPDNYTVIYRDVIISIPAGARDVMSTYYQERVTADLQAAAPPPPGLFTKVLSRGKRELRKILGRG